MHPRIRKRDVAKKRAMEVLGQFETDGSQFLSSKALLASMAEKISCLENDSGLSEQLQENVLTVFEMLKGISRCIYGTLGNWFTEVTGESTEPENLLGMDDLAKLSKLLRYVCAFFIKPYLELRLANNILCKLPINNSLSVREKFMLLYETAINLCSLSEKNSVFRKILMQSCSLDILTALLQLCFSPTSARNLDVCQRKSCLKFLNLLTTSWLSRDLVIKDTIAIQDIATKHSISWLTQKCGSILTRILLGESGIETIIVSMVSSFDDSPEKAGESWERVVALSSIISTLPSSGVTAEDYCRLACPQLQKLLVVRRKTDSTHSKDIIRVAATTLHALHEKYPTESKSFEEHLCQPLTTCEEGYNSDTSHDICTELFECIETLHQVCVSVGMAPPSLVSMLIKPYVKIVFFLLVKIPVSSFLHSQILDIICTLIRKSDDSESADIIMTTFSGNVSMKVPNKNLDFSINEEGDMTAVYLPAPDPSTLLLELDRKVKILLEIIMKQEGVAGDVFLRLIESLCNPSKNIPHQINPNKILTLPERATEAMELNEERFITFGLLTSMLETFDPNVLLSNNSQILEFIKTMICDIPNKILENAADSLEILRMCTSVVGICMLSKLGSAQKRVLKDLVPGLKRIVEMDDVLDDETKELVSDLVIAISTYGAVHNEITRGFSKSMTKYLDDYESFGSNEPASSTQNTVRVEDGGSSIKGESEKASSILHGGQSKHSNDSNLDVNMDKSVFEALEDIHSATPALKGGSIRFLTKCIKNDIPCVVSRIKMLTELFLECMEDDDSFVYLSAVQGLAVISNNCGKSLENITFLERIVTEFANDEKLQCANGVFSKMKLGEVITRIIRDMGDMAPSYASVLFPMFLKLSRHSDSTMRASAISNFAEIAPMAPSMLSSLQFEIRDCLCSASISDLDVIVRRAAVYAIQSIIKTLAERIVEVFPETIKDIYRVLKKLYRSDEDSTVQLHAQLALEELDKIMTSTIFKPQKLTKKISILP